MLGFKRAAAVVAAAVGAAAFAQFPNAAVAAGKPTVAVLDFSTRGLTGDWYGNFQPGVALSDLVTDQIVNSGRFSVVDRSHLASVMQEHNLTTSGEVSPATAVQRGRLIGARYLITGNILQFDKTGASGAGVGALIGGPIGGALSGAKRERVTLKVQVRVIDAVTGQIMQSFADEATQVGSSWGVAAFGHVGSVPVAGGYANEQFTQSTMGHLINDEAGKVATALDPGKFAAGSSAAPATLAARIIAVDGENVILNAGSDKGVAVGMFFDVVKVLQIKDPDSGKMLTSNETVGKIQVISVTGQTAVAKRISGSVVKLASVRAEQ